MNFYHIEIQRSVEHEKRDKMKNLKESFKKKFMKDIPLEIEEDYPTHVAISEMINIVCAASKKIEIDSYMVLKHFQFTEEEIKDHFQKLHASDTVHRKAGVRVLPSNRKKIS